MKESPPHGGADRNRSPVILFGVPSVAPSRGRGSKRARAQSDDPQLASPPHGGADRNSGIGPSRRVARPCRPLTGARIETCDRRRQYAAAAGRPLTGARIETLMTTHRRRMPARRPLTGARIETGDDRAEHGRCDSVAPSRGRGSKHAARRRHRSTPTVAPSRGRGSKPGRDIGSARRCGRPLTGARIETCQHDDARRSARRSPPHGGADRNMRMASASSGDASRRPLTGARIETCTCGTALRSTARSPPHGGADRNTAQRGDRRDRAASPPHGGADRNTCRLWRYGAASASPPHGGADRNPVSAKTPT